MEELTAVIIMAVIRGTEMNLGLVIISNWWVRHS